MVSLNWIVGSQISAGLVNPAGAKVRLTKSSVAKVTAAESLARKLERRMPEAFVVTWSATIAPFAAKRTGATRNPSAEKLKTSLPAGKAVNTGVAWMRKSAAAKIASAPPRKWRCLLSLMILESSLESEREANANFVKLSQLT